MRVGERGTLTLTATRVSGTSPGTAFGISLLLPLENRITSSSNVTVRNGSVDGYTSASQTPETENGLGWRALAGTHGGQAYAEGGAYYQGSKGTLSSDFSASSSQQTVRLGARGGVVMVEGNTFATRRVDQGFALVEVPGYANVGVGFQGSNLTRTNKDGLALLPRLVPYQNNTIRLDPSELPISAEIDSIEQIAVPAERSAVKVVFPVRSGRGALIKIVLDDGHVAPAGAELELVGDKQEFFVARRGEAFVTGLQAKNTLRLKLNGQVCTMTIELPEGKNDDIARVGPIVCSGVKR